MVAECKSWRSSDARCTRRAAHIEGAGPKISRRELCSWAAACVGVFAQLRRVAYARDLSAGGAPFTADTTLVRADSSERHAGR
jgi:hypothetical protein